MKQYASFIFDSYHYSPDLGEIELRYTLDDDLRFVEKFTLPKEFAPVAHSQSPVLDRALAALHLCGGISYYKTCLPKTMEIRTQPLSEDQAQFWNTVYEEGLGEFFYKNTVDFRGLIQFPQIPNPKPQIPSPKLEAASRKPQKILVPIGGGKDSIVTLELLKKAGFDITLLRIGQNPLIDAIAKQAALPILNIKRSLSPRLFDLNEQGALNGHVPITATLSFLSIVVAVLYGFDAIAMSNERSASLGNIEYLGKEINHQWSKSLTFERLFRAYIAENVTADVEYFSLLRPFSELHITKLFTEFPQYLPLTTSCNRNWKITTSPSPLSRNGGGGGGGGSLWCNHCPKCAFVFAMLAAFLPKETLARTFGKNLFDDELLLPLYRELLGLEGFKPFECVGTPEETQAAFLLAHDRKDLDDTAAMKMFLSDVLPTIKNPKKLVKDALTPSTDHCIPQNYLPLIPHTPIPNP